MSESSTAVVPDIERRNHLNKTISTAYRAGLAVLPPKNDRSKSPYPGTWKEFQSSPPTKEMLKEWYGKGLTGIGYVCGAVSGNLECLDFDEREIYPLFKEEAKKALLLDILERIEQGYMEYSPKGVHLLYRCSEIGRSDKLATRPKRPEEMKHAKDMTKTLIETRGEGGYVIVAPSYGNVHPGGEYALLSGDVTTIVEITPEERDDLLALARMFHIPEVKAKC